MSAAASALGAMITVAISIADEAAKALIEGECISVTVDGQQWLDTDNYTQMDTELSYLRARGLLEKHPTRPMLVRINPCP